MSRRVEEYLVSTTGWSESLSAAKYVTREQVAEAARKAGATIDLGYFVATAQHESSLRWNERDTEENGYMSYGIYQIGLHEARSVRMPTADLQDLDQATRVMVMLAENRRMYLRRILTLAGAEADPKDLCAYIAICHNVGEMDGSIRNIPKYGMDFGKWKERNAKMAKEWPATAADLLLHHQSIGSSPAQIDAAKLDLAKAKKFADWVPRMTRYGDDCNQKWPWS